MQRTYNRFDPWVKQDDFLTGWPSFIEHKNVDGLRDGYWITLWPKVNKAVLTWTIAMRSLEPRETWAWDLDRTYSGWDNWEIYKFNSVDNTPEYTLTTNNPIVKVVVISWIIFFFWKPSLASSNIWVAKIFESQAASWNWGTIDETFKPEASLLNAWCPPVLVVWSLMYIWGNWDVRTMDTAGTVTVFWFPDGNVVWLTLQGSTIVIYCSTWNIYFWDWWATSESARSKLWSRIQKVTQIANTDYLTTEDWQYYIWSGYTFTRLTKPKQSFRLNDNSVITERLKFVNDDLDESQCNTMIPAKDDIYIYSSDSTKWMYKYGNVIPWLAKGFHKIITQNHLGTQIDLIYDMYYYERTLRRLYFSYKAGSTFGIDYIDLDSLNTNNTWYAITEVFTWWTSFKKELNRIRINVSNVDTTNTVDLSYRVNNWDWVLLRTINSTTEDIYYRENITTESTWDALREFIDIQLKVEFTSDNGDNTPPTLHELMLDYDIIET